MFDNLLALAEAVTRADGGLSLYQRVGLKAYAGMPLDKTETAVWREATGRRGLSKYLRLYRAIPASEWWLMCGRRAGKTTIGSLLCIWEGLRRQVPEGQSWTIPVIAPGLRQGQKIALDYIRRKMQAIPELREMLVDDGTQDSLTLTSGVVIRTLPPDPRLCQGFTSPFLWLDEASNFRDESAFSNLEDVLDAVRPSVATIPDARIFVSSLPGPKSGLIYEKWQNRFDDNALIFRASSADMNPSLAESEELKKAQKRPEYFQLYFSGEFVEARQALIPAELVDAAIVSGKFEFTPEEVKGSAAGGCDFAASSDDSAAAIAIRTKDDRIVVPWLRNWTVKSGELHPIYSYLTEIAEAFKRYRVWQAVGDQQSLPAASQYLSEKGITYTRLITNGAQSEPIFDFLREQLRAGRIVLPDNEILRQQLKRLEERRDKGYEVAASRGKDDLAVAVAAAIFKAGQLPLSCEPWAFSIFAAPGDLGTDEDRFFRKQGAEAGPLSRDRHRGPLSRTSRF